MRIVLTLAYHFCVKVVFREFCKIVFNRMILIVVIRRGMYIIKIVTIKILCKTQKRVDICIFITR